MIRYHNKMRSTKYVRFLDVGKAFECMNNKKLFMVRYMCF